MQKNNQNSNKGRLSSDIIPSNYKLFFNVSFSDFIFTGKEKITLEIKKPVNEIVLNANGIKFISSKITSKELEQKCKVKLLEKEKTVSLSFGKKISGKCELEIEFSGKNNDEMFGFYRSSYKNKAGKKEYLLSTQFEAADARAAFPCFDEPGFKSKFDISIEIPAGMTAISNMPVKSETVSKGRKNVFFMTTPIMSSYLVFMGVGKFDKLSSKIGKLSINAYATPGKKDLCRLALGYSKKFIEFYEKYFGIKYPMPKVDLIAIPDFAAGAMENWGAITFRETDMLGDEKNSSQSSKERIAEVVAHELAHQWFGDLVTMEWWNDLWLNESFATFMSYKAMEHVFPEWKPEVQYFDKVIATAFSADSINSTHPISVVVHTPEEINEIFDEISYEKGGTFLHMLEDFATPKAFQKGLHNYLKKHSFSNATKYDLWGAIAEESKKESIKNASKIKDFASKWLDNSGYPILIQENSGNSSTFTQKRFIISEPISASRDKQQWIVPLKYSNGGAVRTDIMDSKSISIKMDNSKPVKFNYGQDYLYRVMYTKKNMSMLGRELSDGKISDLDAWGIESDLFALLRSGNIPLADYTNFINDYCMNVGYPANISVLEHIGWLNFMLYGTAYYPGFKKLGIAFSRGILKKVGWLVKKTDKNIDAQLRTSSISLLGELGDKDVIEKSRKLLNSHIKGDAKLNPNLRYAVYSVCANNSTNGLFEKFLKLYKNEKNPEDKHRYLQALGMLNNSKDIKKALSVSMSKEVRLQDSFVIPAILSSNKNAKQEIKHWTFSNWKILKKRYPIGTHMLPRFIENLSMCNTKADYDLISKFFSNKANSRGDILITKRKVLERIKANIRFAEKNNIKV